MSSSKVWPAGDGSAPSEPAERDGRSSHKSFIPTGAAITKTLRSSISGKSSTRETPVVRSKLANFVLTGTTRSGISNGSQGKKLLDMASLSEKSPTRKTSIAIMESLIIKGPRRSVREAKSPTGGKRNIACLLRHKANLIAQATRNLEDPDSERWIYSFSAGLFFGFFIFLNFILIAVETDLRDEDVSESSRILWLSIEVFFLIFFSVEIGMRLRVEGMIFFKDRFNTFDFFIVLTGFIALIIELSTWNDVLNQDESAVGWDMMTMLRILRLMRLIRVIRVFRFFKPLYILATGMVEAMSSMIWMLLFLILMIFSFAIFITRMLGKHPLLVHTLKEIQDLRGRETYKEACTGFDPLVVDELLFSDPCQMFLAFGDVFKSWWTLFQVTTLENWPTVSLLSEDPLLGGSPWWRLFFFIYIFASNLMLLNLLTGTIIESLLNASKQKEEDLVYKEEIETQRVFDVLQEIFRHVDTDENGTLKRSEFIACLALPEIRSLFHSVDIDVSDAEELFMALDMDNSGHLTLEEFLSGFSRCRGVAQSKHIINLNHELYNKTKAMITDTKIEVREVKNTLVYCLALQEKGIKSIMESLNIKVDIPTLSDEYHRLIDRRPSSLNNPPPVFNSHPPFSPPTSSSTASGTGEDAPSRPKTDFSPSLNEIDDEKETDKKIEESVISPLLGEKDDGKESPKKLEEDVRINNENNICNEVDEEEVQTAAEGHEPRSR